MARIRGYSEEDVDLLITDFEVVVAASLQRSVEAAANNLVAARVASSSAGLGPQDVAVVVSTWEEEVAGVLTPYVAEVYTGSAATVAVGLADAFPLDDLPGVPLVSNDFTLTYMKTVSNRLTGVGNELWEDVRNELVDGITLGQSVEQISDRIRGVGFDPVRASRIARTEIHGASEVGSISQLRYVGYDAKQVTKEWLATNDLRTRDTHNLADGQQVTLDEKFVVGGSLLDVPGDPSGAADEIVNCRCSTAFNVDEAPPFRCDSPFLTAAAVAPDAEVCICPLGPDDIAHVNQHARLEIFEAFMESKISPAWGGAKIQKVIDATRKKISPDLSALVDDKQMLTIVDKFYVAKKDTFFSKWATWRQSPAGLKALGPLKKTPTHAKMPTNVPDAPAEVVPSVPEPPLPQLPPIAPKPQPGEIQFTGQTLGSHGAEVWRNPVTGERWLFKPQDEFLTELDIGMAKLQSKAGLTRPAIYKTTINGEQGSLQFMFDSKSAFPGGSFDPLKLSDEDLLIFQKEQIFDWMISNFDTHTGQWIRLADGQLYGVDKGQAFKFFGKDKLDWNYVPVYPLGQDKLTYPSIWKAFVDGKSISLHDPTKGQLGEYIKRLTAIPDATYREQLAPYVNAAAKKFGFDGSKLLDQAVARKNALEADFAAFWQKAVAARSKNVPDAPKPPPVQPTPPLDDLLTPKPPPAIVTPATPASNIGGNVTLSALEKKILHTRWIELGGGKKVTPAWGGAKVYKQLQELKTWAKGDSLFEQLNDAQLLDLLDETGGFVGKPKTYKTVVLDWLNTPASTNTVLKYSTTKLLDPSLKKIVDAPAPQPAVTPVAPTPVQPVVPVANVIDDVSSTLKNGVIATADEVADATDKANIGDVIAYAKVSEYNEVQVYRVTKSSSTTMLVEFRNSKGEWVKIIEPPISNGGSVLNTWAGPVSWKLKPITLAKATKDSLIPGKVPGNDVTMLDLYASRHLWKSGDVLATSVSRSHTGVTTEFRIVAKGDGDAIVQYKGINDEWISIEVPLSADENVWLAGGLTSKTWKLTGDVLKKQSGNSMIPGKSVGEVVTPDEIWSTGGKVGDIVAYGKSDLSTDVKEYRLKIGPTGGFELQSHEPGERWSVSANIPTLSELKWESVVSKVIKWYAAKSDGSVPVNVKATDVVTPKMTKFGVNDQTVITNESIFNSSEFGYAEWEVVALGKPAGIGPEYRIYWVDATNMAIDIRQPGDAWEFWGIVHSPDDLKILTELKWYAGTGKAHASSVSGKAAKQAVKQAAPKKTPPGASTPTTAPKLTGSDTHIPTAKVGDVVNTQGIWDNWEKYDDQQVVATGIQINWNTDYWAPTRLVVINLPGYGKRLVFQKQTSAGTWTGSKVVKQKWEIPYADNGWKAANEYVEAKHVPSLVKAAKKSVPGEAPVKKAAKKSVSSSQPLPSPPSSFKPRDIDITPWNENEQLEMFTHFRTQYHVYTHSSPEQVWSALQGVKQFFQAKYGGKYTKLNEIELLRILDVQSAKKHGVANSYPFESKIVQWLKTPMGKAHVNKRIDAPIATHDVPEPQFDFEASDIPHDKQDYRTITSSEAVAFRDESLAKYGKFTGAQKAALKKYTGGVYTSWNQAIRTGNVGSYLNDIIQAQKGMRPSTRPMMLHRGTSFSELNDPGITSYETLLPYVGRTYVNRGFNSTSVGGHAAFGGQLLIEFECPIGTPMAHVADFSHHKSERETLLPTHLIYKIISVTKKNNTTVMRVRVIGTAEIPT